MANTFNIGYTEQAVPKEVADTLKNGDVAIFSDTAHIIIHKDGAITIKGQVKCEGDMTIDGTLTVSEIVSNGDVKDKNGTLDSLRQTYTSHTHSAHNTPPN